MRLSISAAFLDKILPTMLIMLPVLILFVTSITLVLLKLLNPIFRYNWLIAITGAFLSVVSVVLWQTKLPLTFYLPGWQPVKIFVYTPTWFADGFSWLYAFSLTTLALATISSAIVRKSSRPMNWAGILFIVSIGILAITADNPFTLVITWVALDFAEIITLLSSIKADESEKIVIAFSIRLGGIFLLLWSSILSISSGSPMDFRAIPPQATIYLLLAVILRLGIFPLHLPVKELDIRRGIITTIRLVSAASCLALLVRIPTNAIPTNYLPYLLITTGFFSIYGGWRWLTSSEELNGRPFWILSLGSLAIASTLIGNSSGTVAWGSCLILSGGLIFLYSARGKRNSWIIALGLWGISALPFSLSASSWLNFTIGNGLFIFPHILGQSLILAGYVRHAFTHPGETDIESEPRWIQVIYSIGLISLPMVSIVTGLWGWGGAHTIGNWWAGTAAITLSILFFVSIKLLIKRTKFLQTKYLFPKTQVLSKLLWAFYYSVRQMINLFTSTLEGDGGMLWSIVILVLFISLITQTKP
jgi:hypothetical protein